MHIKCNVFKAMFYSFRPKMYSVLGFQKAGCVFGFVMFFTLLMVGIQGLFMGLSFKTMMSDQLDVSSVEEMMDKYVPDFEIKDGRIEMEAPVEFEADGVVVHIDDSLEKITMSDIDYLTQNTAFDMFIIGGQENLVLYRISDGRYSDITYADFGKEGVTKAELIQLFGKVIDWMIGIVIVVYYIICVAGHFLGALILMLLLFVINIFVRRDVKAGELYKIGVYARVPFSVINLIFFCMPVMMPDEIVTPVCWIVSSVIGAFALYAVHGEKLEETDKTKRSIL